MDEPTSSRQADQKQWREKFLTEVLQSENKKSSHYNVIEEDCNVNLIEDSDDNVEEVSNQDEVCSSENEVQKARKTAAENLVKQAKKMKATSDKSHPLANIGDNVTIPIPDVDKGKGDLRNIIGVILQTNDEGFYKVGTKHGCTIFWDIKKLQTMEINELVYADDIVLMWTED
ncbi:hypothetical protein ILUMI_05851 [Ignelater luminosus]|uniref:Uncharacterized protein n=1 Tax=Ignelater luminosus TaxID=2038154 RepID=A0A8K0D6E5_IGNLU|nr:hypothetical protein ILUMI_05851 [Ignelater luminosus]